MPTRAKKETKPEEGLTAKAWFRGLDNPDNVGASEYRAIHELLADVFASYDEDETEDDRLNGLDGVLDEVIDWGKQLKKELAEKRYPGPTEVKEAQLTDEDIKYASVSTGHMSFTDMAMLDRLCARADGPHTIVKYPEGYFMYVGGDGAYEEFELHWESLCKSYTEYNHFSVCFKNLVRLLCKQKFPWVRFDADAKKYEGLPIFQW